MAFQPVNYEEGKVVLLPAADAITFVKGNALADDGNGLLTNAAGDQNADVKFIAADSLLTTSSGQLINVIPVEGLRILADCEDAPAQTDVGTHCDLAAAGTLDPNSTTDDLFFIESIDLADGAVGTSTKVFGYFATAVLNA